MEVILSTNRTGVDYYFDSQIDSSEGGMGPYWAIHWGSGIIKRLRTPALRYAHSSVFGKSHKQSSRVLFESARKRLLDLVNLEATALSTSFL